MKKTSMKQNAMLSGIQRLFSIIFPLITFPYISRVLQVETIGKVDFSNSIISYCMLIAGLGITNYAIREGAKVRENKEKLEKLCSELFTINLLSTLVAYGILLIIYLMWPKMHNYSIYIFIASFNIIGGTIGINWLYSIFEDYLYITIRTILFQILSLVLMFVLVKTDADGSKYMLISVISAAGMNILNLIHSRSFIKLKITRKVNLKKHFKPIMIIFASSIAITIFVNSDVTIIGWLRDDYEVGIYSIAVKFYNIFKQLVSAMILVALPRVSTYLGDNKIDEYKKVVSSLFSFLFSFAIPLMIGLIMVADIIVPMIAGEAYMPSVLPLQILAISLVCAVAATFSTYTLILPNKLEKEQLKATVISALVNVILNIILIPRWGAKAAAFTTAISELLVFSIQALAFKKYDTQGIFNNVFKVRWNSIISTIIGGIYIICVTHFIGLLNLNSVLKLTLDVLIAGSGYIAILVAFRSEGLNFIKSKEEVGA